MTINQVASHFKTQSEGAKYYGPNGCSGLQTIKWLVTTYDWKYSLPQHLLLYHELQHFIINGKAFPAPRSPEFPGACFYVDKVPETMSGPYNRWKKAYDVSVGIREDDSDWLDDAAVAAEVESISNPASQRALIRSSGPTIINGEIDDDIELDDDVNILDNVEARVAQEEFHNQNLEKFSKGLLNLADVKLTPNITIQPPDPLRIHPWKGVAPFLLKPITYWDPQSAFQNLGIQTPCPNHGLEHAQYVKRHGWGKLRRVQGMLGESFIAGRACICTKCKSLHEEAVKRWKFGIARMAPQVEIDVLKEDADSKIARFFTYNDKLMKVFAEVYPYVAEAFPFYLTFKSALDRGTLFHVHRALRTSKSANDLATEINEKEAVLREHDAIMFYSAQNRVAQLAEETGSCLECYQIFPKKKTCISDTFIRDIQIHQSEALESFNNIFTEEIVDGRVLQFDHACKRASKMAIDHETFSRFVASLMNEWGALIFVVALASVHISDHGLIQACKATVKSFKAKNRHPILRVWIDAARRDGASIIKLLELQPREKSKPLQPFEIVHVNTETQMDLAASELSKFSHMAFDSEYLPKSQTGIDTITAVIQLCVDPSKVGFLGLFYVYFMYLYIFNCIIILFLLIGFNFKVFILNVRNWTSMYSSFASLMASDVVKVCHFKSADINPLQRRFPTIVQNNVVDLLAMLKAKFPAEHFAKKGLDALALHFLNIYLPKDHNHSQWGNTEYTHEQIVYAASDAAVTCLLLNVARHGIPQQSPITHQNGDKGGEVDISAVADGNDKDGFVDEEEVNDDLDEDDVALENDALNEDSALDGDSLLSAKAHKGVKLRKKRKSRQFDIDNIVQQAQELQQSPDETPGSFLDAVLYACQELIHGNNSEVDDSDDAKIDTSGSEIDLEFLASKNTCASIFSYCETLINKYGEDISVTKSIMLPSCLTKEQRARLHSLCAQLLLNSSSFDVGGARRMMISRRTRFEPPLAAIGMDSIGCAVVKVSISGGCTRGVVTYFNSSNTTWTVRYENPSGATGDFVVDHAELCAIFRNRFNLDNTGDASVCGINKDEPFLPQCARVPVTCHQGLEEILHKIPVDWYLKPDALIGQDHSHWMRNCMSMCSCGPQEYAFRLCMQDLSDVTFKIVDGEYDRLHNLMVPSKYSEEQFSKLPRAWWRKWAMYHCPEPKRMMTDFFEWYQLWSNFHVPLTSKDIVESTGSPKTKAFFVSDSWRIFKTEAAYIRYGHLSDLPFYSPYRIVSVTKDGRYIFRCNRTTSPVEGWHHTQRADGNSKAKAAGPRQQHAALCSVAFHWNRKAAEAAGVIPHLGHDEVHLRYKLIQILQDTPLNGKVLETLGWPCLNYSTLPIIPRGMNASSFLPRSIDMPLPTPPSIAHSKLTAQKYIQGQFGLGPVSTLSTGKDISVAIINRDFILSPSATMTSEHIQNFYRHAGLVPTATALEKFTQNQEERFLVQESLDALGYPEHVKRMRTPVAVNNPPVPKRVLILDKSTISDSAIIPAPYLSNKFSNVLVAKPPPKNQGHQHQVTDVAAQLNSQKHQQRLEQKKEWANSKRASMTPEQKREYNRLRREKKAEKARNILK